MSTISATVSSKPPRERGLPPTLGLEAFLESLNRVSDLYYTSEGEPIPNNRFYTVEQRSARKLRDGVETTNPTREQLGEPILRRNIIAQPKTGEDARARTKTIVPDGAGDMVLISCLSEQGVPSLYVGMVSQLRAGVFLYTKVDGVYKAVLSLEAASGFVEKGDTAERASTQESREELGLPPMERHILVTNRPLSTAPALTGVYHSHSTSLYRFKGTINELVEQARIGTSRGKASLSEIASLQQAHFMSIQDFCSLFERKADNQVMFSAAVTSLQQSLTQYLRMKSIRHIKTLSVEEGSKLTFDIPRMLSDGSGNAPTYEDDEFWRKVREDFPKAIQSNELSKESRDSRL